MLWVTGRCFANESVRVFEFGIVHRDEARIDRHIFSTETGFAISPSAIPIKDHSDRPDGMRRSICCQLSQFFGIQIEPHPFTDRQSLHPRFDDGAAPELTLKVVNVALFEFWHFARGVYLTMRQFSIRQDFDYEIARYDRGIAGALIHYRKRDFQRLAYLEGVRCPNQSNVSHDKLRVELQAELLANDDQLPTSKGSIESTNYEQSDSAEPERWSVPAFVIGVLLFLSGNLFVHYGAERAENGGLISFGWHKYWLLVCGFLCLLGGLTLMFLVPFLI